MKKLSSILDNIKERISSPLVFSFALSWIFINWRVTVALLWYDPPKDSHGHLSLIDYIDLQLTPCNSFWLPLLFAIAYTFASPLVRNGIKAFYTWTKKWGDKWNLNISRESKIPMEKYLSLVSSVIEKGKQLQSMIEKEGETADTLEKTQTTLLAERREHQKLLTEHTDLTVAISNLYRINILEGEWNKSITIVSGGKEETQVVQINNGAMFVRKGTVQTQYQINEFIFDSNNRKIQFILFNINQANGEGRIDFILTQLQYHSYDYLSGFEYRPDGRYQVEYRKPKLA